jgi:hypothetical protein
MVDTRKLTLAEATPPIVREYEIGDTRYIVTATAKPGVGEDAAAKVRRLIRKEISKRPKKPGN